MAPLLGRAAVCLLALLWTVADPSAGQSGGDVATRLETIVENAVKRVVQPISAELSSQRTLLSSVVSRLNGLDERIDLLTSQFNVSSDHISSRVDLIHTRVNSVSLQPAELEPTQTAVSSQLETIGARLSSLQTAIGSLNAELDTRYESINSSLNSLQTRLDTLESGLSSHLESENSKLNSLQTRLDSVKTGVISQIRKRIPGWNP